MLVNVAPHLSGYPSPYPLLLCEDALLYLLARVFRLPFPGLRGQVEHQPVDRAAELRAAPDLVLAEPVLRPDVHLLVYVAARCSRLMAFMAPWTCAALDAASGSSGRRLCVALSPAGLLARACTATLRLLSFGRNRWRLSHHKVRFVPRHARRR